MIDRIIIFYGSKKDFSSLLDTEIDDEDNNIYFMELIQQYNRLLRNNDSAVREITNDRGKIDIDNCICRVDDYGSVMEHVITNFVNILDLNHDIKTLFVHNPPRRVLESLKTKYRDKLEYKCTEYQNVDREILSDIYSNLENDILGQDKCKERIVSSIYKLTRQNLNNRPVVVMLYGPSGVGKTESAKSVSKSLGGNLLRIQFSMMQTQEAFDYVFGAEHSRNSLARDFISRESNVVLIDEFDKVSPAFYNAFYEVFDEGKYSDTNYDVDLKYTVFLCTSNFSSEEEIKKVLGPAMFSRIGACIKYEHLNNEQKCMIAEKWYVQIMGCLEEDEKEVIEGTNILDWFKDNIGRYDNIRSLKIKLEQAIFDKLTKVYIIADKSYE